MGEREGKGKGEKGKGKEEGGEEGRGRGKCVAPQPPKAGDTTVQLCICKFCVASLHQLVIF